MNLEFAETIRKMQRDYLSSALLGSWAKAGKGKYQRCTGEVVTKSSQGWSLNGDKYVYRSAWACMSAVDHKYRSAD